MFGLKSQKNTSAPFGNPLFKQRKSVGKSVIMAAKNPNFDGGPKPLNTLEQ